MKSKKHHNAQTETNSTLVTLLSLVTNLLLSTHSSRIIRQHLMKLVVFSPLEYLKLRQQVWCTSLDNDLRHIQTRPLPLRFLQMPPDEA
jgi:Gpi18-like mannosyltransferase